jgi:cytochrome P450
VTLSDGAKNVLFKKDMGYIVNFYEIHHDPDQWVEPSKFVPARFDFSDADNKWTKTSTGEERNPLAFTPFFGGKRICVGKTFAETTIRFTIPLIYQHLNF